MYSNSVENSTVSCKLRIAQDLSGKTPVFLVNFPNGNLNLEHSQKVKFSSYIPVDSSEESKNAKRILRAKSVLEYTSKSEEDSSNGNKFNYFVGVRNKTCKKMKIYKSISYHLNPDLGNDYKSLSSEGKSYRERNKEVDNLYGSKGKKRANAQKLDLSILESSSMEEAVKNMSLNKSVEDTSQTPSSSNDIDYLPPRNSNARTVDEVYNIIDIISSDEHEYLENAAEELLASLPDNISQWKKDCIFCDYVLTHLEREDIDSTKAKYLIYLNYLVTFSKLLSSDFKKKDPAQDIPEPLRSGFFDRFTTASRMENGRIVRNFPLKMKDKLLAYILVIALFIDDFLVNLALVQRGTKYGLPKITTIAQALGCHIRRHKVDNSNVSIAELKLPLYVVYRKHK